MPSKDQRFGYQRKIAIPADWAGKRIKFRCDSAEGLAEVWVNGQPVGKHDGSWAQFELDATAAVRPGQDNTVSIQVSPSALGALTKDSQGGIRRKLYLLALPTVHLAGLQAETRFDAQYRDANLTLTADVANESGEPVAVTVRWRLQGGPNGETVLAKFAGTKRVEATLPVSAPKQWHPEHPHLYALTVEVVRDGQVIETVQRRIGFRQVEVQGDKLLVNGRPIKLRGAMLTMWHDSAGWGGLTDAQRRKLVGQWLEMNMNTCYPNPTPDEELLDLCDELGLAVICMARQTWTKATTENAPLFVQQAANLVADHRNHPSVLIWTMGNESRWGPAFEAMAATYRKLDPDRPFMLPGSGTPAAHVPIDSKHYPGVQGKGGGARPVIFTEYAHVNAYNLAEFKTDPGVRDAWYQELRNLWDSMYASERTAGAMIFAGTDCVGMAWGLVDGWHRPKPEFWHARKLYAPVRVVTNTVADGKRRVTVENRYDVTNLKDLRIEWTAGNQHGTVSADVPPHGQGDFEIPAAPDLTLTFTNPQGRLVDTIRFAAEKPAAPTAPVVGQPALKQTDTSLTVNVGNIEWVFDAKTGLLTGGRRAGKSILTGGPKLCLNEALADWQPAKVDTRKTDAGVEIVATGAYGKAKGQYTMTVDNTGALAVRYDFACAGDKPVQVREIGLEFDVDRACDTLSWQRRAPWTEYPADHIGRDVGTAPAFRDPAGKADDPKVEPGWPWSQDQTEAGTADFRSTKYDVLWASLSAKDGAKVTVRSNGQQAVRVAVAGKLVRLLVDDFCGTGGEKYLRASQRNQLIPVGGKLTGAVRLELGE
jgi:beta-galactosidase/beta-glucuronidase